MVVELGIFTQKPSPVARLDTSCFLFPCIEAFTTGLEDSNLNLRTNGLKLSYLCCYVHVAELMLA